MLILANLHIVAASFRKRIQVGIRYLLPRSKQAEPPVYACETERPSAVRAAIAAAAAPHRGRRSPRGRATHCALNELRRSSKGMQQLILLRRGAGGGQPVR